MLEVRTPAQKAEHVRAAQDELRRISPRQHPELVSAIQAKLLALQGRGGDTEIAHVTPGEVVIPRNLQTPAVMRTLAAEALRAGIDPRRYTVGHHANSVNPRTGKPEFADLCGGNIGECEVRDPRWPAGIEIFPVTGVRPPSPSINIDPGSLIGRGNFGPSNGNGGGGNTGEPDWHSNSPQCQEAKNKANDLESQLRRYDDAIQSHQISIGRLQKDRIRATLPGVEYDTEYINEIDAALQWLLDALPFLTKDRIETQKQLEKLQWQNSDCFGGRPA